MKALRRSHFVLVLLFLGYLAAHILVVGWPGLDWPAAVPTLFWAACFAFLVELVPKGITSSVLKAILYPSLLCLFLIRPAMEAEMLPASSAFVFGAALLLTSAAAWRQIFTKSVTQFSIGTGLSCVALALISMACGSPLLGDLAFVLAALITVKWLLDKILLVPGGQDLGAYLITMLFVGLWIQVYLYVDSPRLSLFLDLVPMFLGGWTRGKWRWVVALVCILVAILWTFWQMKSAAGY